MPDLRFLAGPCLIALGVCFLIIAARLWWGNPFRRVLRLEPFVTPDGLRTIIRLRLTFAALGAFLTVYGSANVLFWFDDRSVFDPLVQFLGTFGTCLGLLATFMVLTGVARLVRLR